jgi:hypothetical protein
MPAIVRNLFGLLLVVLLAGCSGKKESTDDKKDGSKTSAENTDKKTTEELVKTTDKDGKPPIEQGATDLKVSGKAIRTEFRDDREKALAKYRGKLIEVESPVLEVGASLTGESYLILAGPTEPLELKLQCYTIEKEPWSKVSPGQTVKLKGRCGDVVGEELLLQFRECAIVSVSGPGAIAVAAEKLVEEYAKDPAAAAKMYDDRYLLLTGEVDKVEVIDAVNKPRIVLKTGGKISLSCVAEESMLTQAKRLKPGQPVKLLGKQRPFSPTEGIDLIECVLFAKP